MPNANPAAKPPVSGMPECEIALKIWSPIPGKNGAFRLKPSKLVIKLLTVSSTFAQFKPINPLYCK